MNSELAGPDLASVAAAIAEPARARILSCLMDGHARTATELSVVAEVGAPTTSAHLARLKAQGLVALVAQGKHRYYRLAGSSVGAALEALLVVAGAQARPFVPSTPTRLRRARTCYDHMAGALAVALIDRLAAHGWIVATPGTDLDYELSEAGELALSRLGVDIGATRGLRRRFACSCLDWSERRPHLGGALGAALLQLALQKRWVTQDLDSRALGITALGERAFRESFDLPNALASA